MSKLNARFSAAHEYFGGIKVGRDALDTYEYWRAEGKSHDEAEILASNVLQRAGYNVNARGGISIDTDEPAEPAEPDEPDDPREHAHIHLRVLAETKGRWVRQSREEGKKLTDWIVDKVEAGINPASPAEQVRLLNMKAAAHELMGRLDTKATGSK